MDVIENVRITQFVNPHLFWLQKTSIDYDTEFIKFKGELNRHYKHLFGSTPHLDCKLRVGDRVACFSRKEKAWFRAEIDLLYQDARGRNNNVVVWLVDCGRSVEAHSDFIRPLDEKFLDANFKHVFKAGISGVIPAERTFDFSKDKDVLAPSRLWSRRTLANLTSFFDDIPEMDFHVSMVERQHNHLFGDLVCKSFTGEPQWARDLLLKSSSALPVAESEFFEKLHTQSPNVFSLPRFKNNEGLNVFQKDAQKKEVVQQLPDQLVRDEAIPKDSEPFMTSNLANSYCSDSSSVKSEPRLPRGVPKENVPEKRPELPKAPPQEAKESSSRSISRSRRFKQVMQRSRKPPKPFAKPLKELEVVRQEEPEELRKPQPAVDVNLKEQTTSLKTSSNKESKVTLTTRRDHVIVHGKTIRPPLPFSSYKEANFTPEVNKCMAKIASQPKRLQAHVWPHLMRESSAVIVGSPETGKTFSYLPAVCSHVQLIVDEGELTGDEGPIAIVVLSSADDVSKAFHSCRHWFSESQDVHMLVVAYGRLNHEVVEAKLLHGAGLLLTTPPCLERLLGPLPLINREKLRMIVVDDYDTCLRRFGTQVDGLLEKLYVRPLDGRDPPQVIVTSSEWHQNLLKYSAFGKNCALFLDSYTEAAIYGLATIKLRLVNPNFRVQVLYEIHLKSQEYKQKRTVIVCRDDKEVLELCRMLRSDMPDVLVTSHVLKSASTGIIAKNWYKQATPESVLIVSDDSLGDLEETQNALVLINYSPASTWSRLTKRFSVVYESFHNYFINRREPEGFERPKIFIFASETDDQDCFPKLERFMRRICKPPQEFSEMAQRVLREQNQQHESLRLCNNLVYFGECREVCRDRHSLQRSDKPSDRMPLPGQILKLKITKVHSPIHYSARVLASQEVGQTRWKEHPQNLLEIELEMRMFYGKDENLQTAEDIKKGEIYTWSGHLGQFHRVQVLSVDKRGTREGNEAEVLIRYIDSGYVERHLKGASYLLEIPNHLKAYPPMAVDVHYSGIVPTDGDTVWDRETFRIAFRILNNGDLDEYVVAHVTFVLEGHIWTKRLSTVRQNALAVVHQKMLRENLCEEDPEERGLKAIRNLASKIELFVAKKKEPQPVPPVSEPVLPPEPVQARCSFDYLESQTLIPVNIHRVDEDGTCYFYRLDKKELFMNLLNKIDSFVADESNLKPLESFEKGQLCLALLEDGYIRARIIGPGHQEDSYSCYMGDLGEIDEFSRDSLVETTDELTKMAPFLAIRGRLFGILPAEGSSFSEEELSSLDRELLKTTSQLYARVIKSLPNSDSWNSQWGLNFYDLLIVCFHGEELVLLNENLCEKGVGRVDPDPFKNFKMIDLNALRKEIQTEEETAEEDWEDWEKDVGTFQAPELEEGAKAKEEDPLASLEMDKMDEDELADLFKMFGLDVEQKRDSQAPKPKASEPKKQLKEERPVQTSLKQKYRSPNVVWHQNEELIMLYIAVGDVEEYFLEVTPKYLVFQMTEHVSAEPRMLVLNFFGVVDVRRMSHEKRGLNVVVRLPKLGFSEWPRLTEQKTKLPYLKYKLEAIHLKEDYVLPGRNGIGDAEKHEEDDASSASSLEFEGEDFEDFQGLL